MTGNFNRLAGLGIATGSGTSRSDLKGSKTADNHFVAFGQGFFDKTKKSIDCAWGGTLGEADFSGNFTDEFVLGHMDTNLSELYL